MENTDEGPAPDEAAPGKQTPKDTRFKPGQSGNPAGRPKGSCNLRTKVLQQLRQSVTVMKRGKPVKMTKVDVIANQMVDGSMKGDHKATVLVMKIDEERKNFKPRKIILGFALGSKHLFSFLDNNPIFEFHPTSYTNDPGFIARNDNMVAINSALQVDLTGQVCSDSIGNQFYSGIGGQVDFIRGASRSKGGKPIIAISSTAKDGAISRIVPMLSPGAGVVTSRGLIRYVVTEFGVAYLHGKTIRERAQALIDIAHPKFREELYEYCEKSRWLQRPLVAADAGFQIHPVHGL